VLTCVRPLNDAAHVFGPVWRSRDPAPRYNSASYHLCSVATAGFTIFDLLDTALDGNTPDMAYGMTEKRKLAA